MTRWLRFMGLLAAPIAALTGELILFGWERTSHVRTIIRAWNSCRGLTLSGDWMAAAVLVLIGVLASPIGVKLSDHASQRRRAWRLAASRAGVGCLLVTFLSPFAFMGLF